jgi:hypothetical protein
VVRGIPHSLEKKGSSHEAFYGSRKERDRVEIEQVAISILKLLLLILLGSYLMRLKLEPKKIGTAQWSVRWSG